MMALEPDLSISALEVIPYPGQEFSLDSAESP